MTGPKLNRFTTVAGLATLFAIWGPPDVRGWQALPAQDKEVSHRFMRLHGPQDNPAALQTSVARYTSDSRAGVIVDLVGAVHIGEGEYFATLNELLRHYDVVLYELVAEPGTRIPEGGGERSANPVSFLQTTARNFLGLESQLEKIDYTRKNFRHADLGPGELAERMRQRGDTGWSLALDTFAEMMQRAESAKPAGENDPVASLDGMLELLSDPLKAKQFVARQMGDPAVMELGLGKKLNQLIVQDRNEAAMTVLDEVLDEGRTRVAIFYGAAHMPDFETRLRDRGFQPAGEESWITAWDLTRSHATGDNPMSLMMKMMRELDR